MTMQTVEDPTADATMAEVFLNEHVILVSPTISLWQGQYQLPSQKLKTELADQTLESKHITTPKAKLLTDDSPVDRRGVAWKKRFSQIDSTLSKLKDTYTIPFHINGIRILPRGKIGEFMDALYGTTVGHLRRKLESGSFRVHEERAVRQLLDGEFAQADPSTMVLYPRDRVKPLAMVLRDTVDEFVGDYDNVRAQLSTSPVWASVHTKVPRDAAAMRHKFSLSVTPIEIASGSLTKGTTDEMLMHTDVVRSACRQQVSAAIESMISAPRAELDEAINNLQTLIANEGAVSAGSYMPIRRAIEKIRMFEFVADDDLKQKMSQLQTQLDTNRPTSVRDDRALASVFSQQLGEIREAVSSEVARATAVAEFVERRGRAIGLLDD
jgi:hypothetical protein